MKTSAKKRATKKLQENGLSREKLDQVLNSQYFKEKDDKAREMLKNANWEEWLKVFKG